eukprot:gene7742-9208_t
MSSMSAGVKVFNFNLSFLLNIKCLTHHFSRVPSVGSYFWTDFWQSVALPPTLCLLFTLAYWCLVWRRERQRHRHWRMAMVAAETGEHNVERAVGSSGAHPIAQAVCFSGAHPIAQAVGSSGAHPIAQAVCSSGAHPIAQVVCFSGAHPIAQVVCFSGAHPIAQAVCSSGAHPIAQAVCSSGAHPIAQTNILINQLVIQVMLVMVQLHEYEDDEELIIGISLVLLQIALLMYTMSIIIHVWRVVMRPVFSDSPIPTWFADFRDRLARRDPSHKQETERNRATTELVEQPVLISNPFYSNEPEDPLEPVIEGPLPSTSLDNTGIPQSTPLELTDLPSKDQSHGIDDVCHEHAEIMDYSGATVIQKLKSVLESSEFDVSEGNSSNKETTVAGAPALCPDHS